MGSPDVCDEEWMDRVEVKDGCGCPLIGGCDNGICIVLVQCGG